MSQSLLARLLVSSALSMACLTAHAAEDRFAKVQIKTIDVANGIKMLEGAGGNIGVSIGSDGTLIIDSQYPAMGAKIGAALKALGSDGPKFLLNTHYHGDHTGANAHFGAGATIIAHSNVRSRLLANDEVPASALPTVVFEDRLRLHINGDAVDLVHLPHGHTDGDSFVWFQNANVIHLGDHFFNGRFPYVDIDACGSVGGYRRNLERVLLTVPSDVQVIPGHGALANSAAVAATVKMLRETQGLVTQAIAKGTTVEAMVARGLPAKWRDWGAGFINEERWIQTLYKDAQTNSGVSR